MSYFIIYYVYNHCTMTDRCNLCVVFHLNRLCLIRAGRCWLGDTQISLRIDKVFSYVSYLILPYEGETGICDEPEEEGAKVVLFSVAIPVYLFVCLLFGSCNSIPLSNSSPFFARMRSFPHCPSTGYLQ